MFLCVTESEILSELTLSYVWHIFKSGSSAWPISNPHNLKGKNVPCDPVKGTLFTFDTSRSVYFATQPVKTVV